MRKYCFTVICSVTLSALTFSVWAIDFWEKKKFTQWSDKEVTKILTKSPWARSLSIAVARIPNHRSRASGSTTSPTGGGSEAAKSIRAAIEATDRTEARDYPKSYTGGSPGDQSNLGGGHGISRPSGRFQPRVTLAIRWYSALPIKQAMVKTRFENHIDASKHAAELLQKEPHYVIGISGIPFPTVIRHFELVDSHYQTLPSVSERMKQIFDRTKSASFLKIKNRNSITAESVRVQQSLIQNVVDAGSLTSAADMYFIFPRFRDGVELITLKDKKVEFVTQIGPFKIKRKFKLKDMVYNRTLEL